MFNVLIVGAGPAGCAAAIALKNQGVDKVALLDRQHQQHFTYGESAVPGIRAHLARLALPDNLEQLGHLPCQGSCAVWGHDELAYRDYFLVGMGSGWHLDRTAFDSWLRQQAIARGVEVYLDTAVTRIQPQVESTWLVHTNNNAIARLHARFLVDATGRRAAIATRLGSQRRKIDHLVAIALTTPIHATGLIKQWSLIEAVPAGWWYTAAIPNAKAVLMFMTDPDVLRALGLRQWQNWFTHYRETSKIQHHLPLASDEEISLNILNACSQYLTHVAGSGWLAIGDAALSLDPLTSSGISNALDDGLAAAEVIMAWQGGHPAGLDRYAARINQAWLRYLRERQMYYAMETRWRSNIFWQRRFKQ